MEVRAKKALGQLSAFYDIEYLFTVHEHVFSPPPKVKSAVIRLRRTDVQRLDCDEQLFSEPFAVIGNFPYNISSQILFKVYDYRDQVPEVVGMFQKEVAERVAARLSAFYDIEYLFTVHEHVFSPPPKVKSAVIRLRRNDVQRLDCDEQLFARVVKIGFNQRRKTLRNALRQLSLPLEAIPADLLALRAEQLTVDQFVQITQLLSQSELNNQS